MLAVTLLPVPAPADDLSSFTSAVGAAARHHRAALAHLRADNLPLASAELAEFSHAWQDIGARFGKNRPAAFDEKQFTLLLVDMPLRIIAARMFVDLGRPEPARAALEAIRDTLSTFRRAHQIEGLSDCLLDARDALRGVDSAASPLDALAQPVTVLRIRERTVAYAQTLRRCADLPLEHAASARRIGTLFESAQAVAAGLIDAVGAQDRALVQRHLHELRTLDDRLTMEFG